MALIYPMEDRARARQAVIRLNDLAGEAKRAAERGLILPAATEAGIRQLTQTEDRSRQVDALSSLAFDLEKRHLDRLAPLAHDEFNAFCEFINPSEPPASRWHIFLTDTLQKIEFDPELDRFILNCPPGHAKPLHIDTPVLMGDGGWKRLGDVAAGDHVLSDTGKPRLVEAVHDQGELPLLKLTTTKGRVIFTAYDHSFRVKGAWKPAERLRPGDVLDIVGAPADPDREADRSGQSEDVFRLAGFVATQGSHTRRKNPDAGPTRNFLLWFSERYDCDQATAICDRLGLEHSVHWVPANRRFMLRMHNRSVGRFIDLLGLENKAPDKRVPAWVFLGSDRKVKAYLNTVFNQRATALKIVRPLSVSIGFASEGYARDLQRLLTRFGVDAKLRTPTTGAHTRVLIQTFAIEALLAAGVTFPGWGTEAFTARRKPTADLPHDSVKTVEMVGSGPCKCLTVEVDHTFVAEGVVVHNSTYASRLFVAWRLGRNPNLRIIGGGHSQRFVENEFSAKIRNLVGSPDYKRVFPDVVVDYTTRAKDQWAIAGKTGSYAAKGVGQAVHGFRANFVCVDDPYAKIEEAESAVQREKVNTWFVGDLGSRMLPFGKMFLIMTRFHEEDLTGYLMEMNKRLPKYARWSQVEAPALCIDPETDVLGRKLGDVLWDYYDLSYFVAKQTEWSFQRFSLVYQQNASAMSTDNVSGAFNYYDLPPHLEDSALKKARAEGHIDEAGRPKPNRRAYFRKVILSVDTASKVNERADYTVVQTWGETHDRKYYLLRQTRVKVEFDKMIEVIEKQAIKDSVDAILVEDKGQGTAYIQNRGITAAHRRLAPAPIIPIDPKGQSKEFRFDEITPMISGGEVYLPKKALWLDNFVKEVGQFPEGAHDDQVDAMTQALRYFKNNRTRFGSKKVSSYG